MTASRLLGNQFAPEPKPENEGEGQQGNTATDLLASIDGFGKNKKAKKEDTHTRVTFLVDNNLLKRFDSLGKRKGRGWKSAAINSAIAAVIAHAEGK